MKDCLGNETLKRLYEGLKKVIKDNIGTDNDDSEEDCKM